jgi:uncharacterized protein (DUF1800 family)
MNEPTMTASSSQRRKTLASLAFAIGAVAGNPALAQTVDTDGDGIPDSVETRDGLLVGVRDNDLFADGKLFAMQQFRDFLGREGDSAGVSYWQTRLDTNAVTRAQMAEEFLASAEFQNRIAPVVRLYFAFYNRIPDTAGLTYWIGEFQARGLTPVANAFATAPEFVATYGQLTNDQFVRMIYRNLLGRDAEAAGLAYWRGELDAGRVTRGAAMVAFSESAEYRARIGSRVFVVMAYTGMLRRAPDQGGFDFWVGEMGRGRSGRDLVGLFLDAAEYRERFLPLREVSRLLDHTTFGATDALLTQVQTLGMQRFVDRQLAARSSAYAQQSSTAGINWATIPAHIDDTNRATCDWDYSNPPSSRAQCARENYSLFPVVRRFWQNAVHGEDQLRQRVAWAYSQIFVVSSGENYQAFAMAPYQQMLLDRAFGNFRDILTDVTLSPTMGRYLDMVNNGKGDASKGEKPNENYARELLQLFTIGVFKLNIDGTVELNQGKTIPAYSEDEVVGYSRVFTGWTFPGATPGPEEWRWNYGERYNAAMIPFVRQFSCEEKVLLGGVRIARTFDAQGRCNPTEAQMRSELSTALDSIFRHPNVGPFIGRQLIQHLVMSNPSPAYVSRVAAVFNDNGRGVRGDMSAVVRAIVLDSEARSVTVTANRTNAGKLAEGVLFITRSLRGLDGSTDGVALANWLGGTLGQSPFSAPSVFNFYPPDFEVPGAINVQGPEFGIYSASTAVARQNFINGLTFWDNSGKGWETGTNQGIAGAAATRVDLQPFLSVEDNPNQMLDRLNRVFFGGAMPDSMRAILLETLNKTRFQNTWEKGRRARTAVYLTLSSPQWQVRR